ncbi:MAG: hypothetical protein M0R22_00370 [Dehalococcoidia bacterium]|jgi:hypothetical protein|nr:hypothetical protein [Dehalococcoidia bacterium]
MNTDIQAIQEAIIAEFKTQDKSPRRRDDVIASVMNSGKFFVSEVRDTFNALTSAQHILRRQSWYVLAERPAAPPPPLMSKHEIEQLVLATLPKNANSEEHPASSFHHDGPRDRPDWTVENVEAALRRLSERPAGYAPVRRCSDPACGWYTVLPTLPLEPIDSPTQAMPGVLLQNQLLDLAQKGRESLALSEKACEVLEAACSTIAALMNVEVRLKAPTAAEPKPVRDMTTEESEAEFKKKYDAWADAYQVVGTEAHTLGNATSEALCREVVWRLATGKLPDALEAALVNVLQARLAQPVPMFVTKHQQKMAGTMEALRRAGAFKKET